MTTRKMDERVSLPTLVRFGTWINIYDPLHSFYSLLIGRLVLRIYEEETKPIITNFMYRFKLFIAVVS